MIGDPLHPTVDLQINIGMKWTLILSWSPFSLMMDHPDYSTHWDSMALTISNIFILWSFLSLNSSYQITKNPTIIIDKLYLKAFLSSEFINWKLPKLYQSTNQWLGHTLAKLSLHRDPVEERHVFWAPEVAQGPINRLWPLLVRLCQ